MTARVLLVDPDEDILRPFAKSLAPRGFEAMDGSNERYSLRYLCESAPVVLVLEPAIDHGWGFNLLTSQEQRFGRSIPTAVVFILNSDEIPESLNGLTTISEWPVATSDLANTIKRIVRTPQQLHSAVTANLCRATNKFRHEICVNGAFRTQHRPDLGYFRFGTRLAFCSTVETE